MIAPVEGPYSLLDVASHLHGGAHGGATVIEDVVLTSLVSTPIAIVTVLLAVQEGARHGLRPAQGFVKRYARAPGSAKLGALLMVVAAAIHLALIPGHASRDSVTAALFALDGLGLLALALGACAHATWRGAGAALLGASVLAYVAYLATGHEAPDTLGVFTTLVELAALGLLLVRLPRQSAARPATKLEVSS